MQREPSESKLPKLKSNVIIETVKIPIDRGGPLINGEEFKFNSRNVTTFVSNLERKKACLFTERHTLVASNGDMAITSISNDKPQQDSGSINQVFGLSTKSEEIKKQLEDQFQSVNDLLSKNFPDWSEGSGTTYERVLVDTRNTKCVRVFTVKAGDGDVYLITKNQKGPQVIRADVRDTPNQTDEKNRIQKLGGAIYRQKARRKEIWRITDKFITERGTQNGNSGLSVSAGCGNFGSKYLRRSPRIQEFEYRITNSECNLESVVITTDGLTEMDTEDGAIDFVKQTVKKIKDKNKQSGYTAEELSQQLISDAAPNHNVQDNSTVGAINIKNLLTKKPGVYEIILTDGHYKQAENLSAAVCNFHLDDIKDFSDIIPNLKLTEKHCYTDIRQMNLYIKIRQKTSPFLTAQELYEEMLDQSPSSNIFRKHNFDLILSHIKQKSDFFKSFNLRTQNNIASTLGANFYLNSPEELDNAYKNGNIEEIAKDLITRSITKEINEELQSEEKTLPDLEIHKLEKLLEDALRKLKDPILFLNPDIRKQLTEKIKASFYYNDRKELLGILIKNEYKKYPVFHSTPSIDINKTIQEIYKSQTNDKKESIVSKITQHFVWKTKTDPDKNDRVKAEEILETYKKSGIISDFKYKTSELDDLELSIKMINNLKFLEEKIGYAHIKYQHLTFDIIININRDLNTITKPLLEKFDSLLNEDKSRFCKLISNPKIQEVIIYFPEQTHLFNKNFSFFFEDESLTEAVLCYRNETGKMTEDFFKKLKSKNKEISKFFRESSPVLNSDDRKLLLDDDELRKATLTFSEYDNSITQNVFNQLKTDSNFKKAIIKLGWEAVARIDFNSLIVKKPDLLNIIITLTSSTVFDFKDFFKKFNNPSLLYALHAAYRYLSFHPSMFSRRHGKEKTRQFINNLKTLENPNFDTVKQEMTKWYQANTFFELSSKTTNEHSREELAAEALNNMETGYELKVRR